MSILDCIHIAASECDFRFTCICVARIRYFYPEVPIRLLVGGRLQRGLANELQHYWDVGIANLSRGDDGWGFVKLEPLFAPPGERILGLDSDTVTTGPAFDLALEHDEDFILDDERQSAEGAKAIYYDCEKAAEEGCAVRDPAFLLHCGLSVLPAAVNSSIGPGLLPC